jgi:hypothetical protein
MTALPPSSEFTGSSVTEGQFKTAVTGLHDFLAGLLGTTGTQSAALIAIGAIGNGIVDKSATYTVVAADRGKIINATTGTWDLVLSAAATLGAGFTFGVRNSGSGVITINPEGSEQINGTATVALATGESCIVTCTGADFLTLGHSTQNTLNVQTFTTSGTWTKPAKGQIAIIECWGGGGSGARETNNLAGGGGGGAYIRRVMPLSALSSTETVTVGQGGASKTANGAGNNGGNTTFGSHVTGYGGQGGSSSGSTAPTNPGGGGGGEGYNSTSAYGKPGRGGPGSGNGGGQWASATLPSSNGTTISPAEDAYHGGGGGGAGSGEAASLTVGGRSIYGGGGGGGCYTTAIGGTGGTSVYGGNGGNGSSTAPTAGAQPGGGGGAGVNQNSGAGGDGKCVVTVI